jgi:CheY-like chemotaxis protein
VLIDSIVGRGTVVQCLFPGIATEGVKQQAPTVEAPRGAGQRKLYVEDETLLARVGLRRLELLGYQASIAAEGSQALSRIQAQPKMFGLVITDYWMPGMTGLDLARDIHKLRPDLPIILLTGFLDELTPDTLERCGIRKVINKPATTQEIATAVHSVFQSRETG